MSILTAARPIRSRPWAAYVVAVLVTLLGVAVILAFASALQPFPLVVAAASVTVVAFLGGRGPAILTAALSELAAQYFLVAPVSSFALSSPSLYVGLLFYVGLCAIIISLMQGLFSANDALHVSEASLQSLNDDLERRISERTATLVSAQEELQHTNRNLEAIVEARYGELKAANEEIQRFAYIVSHDLRAPLVNVLGFSSELETLRLNLGAFLDEVEEVAPALVTAERRAAIETELPEALGFIRSSTQKMDRLINAILKLSREGRRKLTAEPIDMNALVENTGATLSQQLSAKRAELVVQGSLPPLVSDRLAVEQIFGNLIENAVKYLSPERPGRIVVAGRVDGPTLRYDIVDNGRGIEAKDFERIFDLFRRAGEQDTPGEGIGLAYVRNLVRRLGGSVGVQSEYGAGSTFSVTLHSTMRSQPAQDERAEAV